MKSKIANKFVILQKRIGSFLFILLIVGCGNKYVKTQENVSDKPISFQLIPLKGENGSTVGITNFGARVASWYVHDKNDSLRNIVLGFSTQEQYQNAESPFYGAIVGRYANRLENFNLNGEEVQLTMEDYLLHGGKEGFHYKLWTIENQSDSSVVLSYVSKEGEGGFPGNVSVQVEYVYTKSNQLAINYTATTDKATPLNLTNHSFFNLKGAGNGSVLDVELQINADQFTPLLEGGLPTGEIQNVENTVFDFRTPKTLLAVIESEDPQIVLAKGLDHNFVNPSIHSTLIKAVDPQSGIQLEMKTSQPGVQVYTSNYLSGNDVGDDGKAFKARESICFEAQFFANSPKHENFPNVIITPNTPYEHSTVYKVSKVTHQTMK